MLQSVRDKLKGTFAAVVIAILVVPLVVTGIGGSSFFGSVAGTDAAKVDKKKISRAELSRSIFRRQEQMRAQGIDAASDQLKEEFLREPVLDGLIRRAALVSAAEKSLMGVSDSNIDAQIVSIEAFQVEGKFDQQVYQRLLSANGYTPTLFKELTREDLILQQSRQGIVDSSFVAPYELGLLASILEEKRSFAVLTLPVAQHEESIELSDPEITTYYEGHPTEFTEPEKVSVSYLELSVEKLIESIQPAEESVRQLYEEEKMAFQEAPSAPDVKIAHLMLEENDDGSEVALMSEIQQKLADGEDFAELVRQYSADEGSRESGGELGALIKDVYAKNFEEAALSLEEGEISAPVATDDGLHLIKALTKSVRTYPSFEDKRLAIEQQMKRSQAEEIFASSAQTLEDLTFSAENLDFAAAELNLDISDSPLFDRNSGTAIANNKGIRDAAFRDEVLLDRRNSPRIEISPGHAVVLRLKEHIPEHVKSIDLVRDSIVDRLKKEKLSALMAEEADSVIAQLKAGAAIHALSEEKKYELNEQTKVKRSEAPVDFNARLAVFEMPPVRTGEVAYKSVEKNNGDYMVLVLSEVIAGKLEDLAEDQLNAVRQQLIQQNAQFEYFAYENRVVASAKVKKY